MSYQVKRLSPNLSSLNEGEIIQTELVIIHVSASKTPLKIIGENKSGQIKLVFFNKISPFIYKLLYLKNKITICDKVQFFNGEWQISHPDFIFGSNLIYLRLKLYIL